MAEREEMIRVFVGCAPNGEDAESQAVLEYSLRKHASLPVSITWMQLSRDPASPFYSDGQRGWQSRNWSTPFSGFRWYVPSLCGFEGKAIYTDSDVIFMADIAELWRQEFRPGKCVMGKGGEDAGRLCVSLWDCREARWHVAPSWTLRFPTTHSAMQGKFKDAPFVQAFEGNWNCIDLENYDSPYDPDIKVIHYSQESTQPHLSEAVPRLAREGRKHWFDGTIKPHWRGDLVHLFNRLYREALEDGFHPGRYKPATPFGDYQLMSHAKYGQHRWAK